VEVPNPPKKKGMGIGRDQYGGLHKENPKEPKRKRERKERSREAKLGKGKRFPRPKICGVRGNTKKSASFLPIAD